jgi:DNA invertase Pin-like site-specific DNA recombinase
MKQVRCAIYTRKSSEDGLEQGFNSLHAQREACAAYVLSQASEGWTLLPGEYDDGGLSGGTLQRPALQRLLADVAAGKIDIIVVYKVDRLTRSLLDFAKLVEALDQSGTSFVSITQSFNTTTSMGRLTLNMLLSFAQFEREVTAERIRDKIAASKAKGMWMGGIPPLGYRPDGRSLAVVEEHAAIVRDIHARYRKLGNVRLVADQLINAGITSPVRTLSTGKRYGGAPFSRGQLYAILRNPIYVGEIAHKGRSYPGQHPPILERAEWEAVQRRLDGNIQGERRGRTASASPLAGKLVDAMGQPLVATHAAKGQKRYRYYVSKALQTGTAADQPQAWRIPAGEIEQLVASELAALTADPLDFAERTRLVLAPATLQPFMAAAKALAAQLHDAPAKLIARLVSAVRVLDDQIEIELATARLAAAVKLGREPDAPATLVLACPVRLTRTGRAVRLVHSSGAPATGAEPDLALIRLVARAREWWSVIAAGEITPVVLAVREGVTVQWLLRVMRLAFLSPEVTEALVGGKLAAGVDGTALLAIDAIALDWSRQETLLAG